jgi:hypothetical protein
LSFSIEKAEKRLEKTEYLAVNLLISGLLPIIGVLISAAELRLYSIPILGTILFYLYKVIGIVIQKEENLFQSLVKKEEETEKILNYFQHWCILITSFSIISRYIIVYPPLPIHFTQLPIGPLTIPLEDLTLGEIISLVLFILSLAFFYLDLIKLHLKRTIRPSLAKINTFNIYYSHKIQSNLTKISENIKSRNKQ